MLEKTREILRGARIDSKDSERLIRLITHESAYGRRLPLLDIARANHGEVYPSDKPRAPYPGAQYKIETITHLPLSADECSEVERALEWFRSRYGS